MRLQPVTADDRSYTPLISLVGFVLMIALVVGIFGGMWSIHQNEYLSLGMPLAAFYSMADSVNRAVFLGFGFAAVISLCAASVLFVSKHRGCALAATFFGMLIAVPLTAGLFWLIPRLVHPLQLPFFMHSADRFSVFMYRMLSSGLGPVAEIVFFAGFFVVLTLCAMLVFHLTMRRSEASAWWCKMFTASLPGNIVAFAAVFAGVIGFNIGPMLYKPKVQPNRPNILLISIDTLRTDALGCYGGDNSTPNIDTLAREGVLFEECYANAPWTLPSHGALFTSRLPGFIPLATVDQKLPPSALTLAEELRNDGYRTGAVVGALFVSSAYGFDQGFSTFHHIEQSDCAVDAAKAFIDVDSNKPWFLFLHLYSPHWPYAPVDPEQLDGLEYDDRVILTERRDYRAFQYAAKDAGAAALLMLRDAYDADVREADAAVGSVVDYVGLRQQDENTLIVLVSDHGEDIGEHGSFGHSIYLDEPVLRVPLIFRYGSALPRGKISRRPVDLLDVAPTILGLAGLNPALTFTGRNIEPAFTDQPLNHTPHFAQTALTDQPAKAVVWNFWKRITPILSTHDDLLFRRPPALYYLKNDPGESNNLNGRYPEIEREYGQMLDLIPDGIEGGEKAAISDAERNLLNSIGYLQ